MVGDKTGLLPREPKILEQLGNVKDIVMLAKTFKDQLLNHRGAPASASKSGLDWTILDHRGKLFFLRLGQLARTTSRLLTRRPFQAVAHKQSPPFGHSLDIYTQDKCDLVKTLTIHHSENRQQIFD